jgi:tRNA threonylcarbamoyladenosine modification (KEOPS) complex  Pcc1 subunit
MCSIIFTALNRSPSKNSLNSVKQYEIPEQNVNKYIIALLVLSGFLSFTTTAEQLSFKRHAGHYSYLWQDQQGNQQALEFSLLNYPHKLTKFIQFRPEQAQQYVQNQLKPQLKQIDPRQARVQLNQNGGELSVQLQGDDPALIKQLAASLNQQIDQHYQDYLSQHYFIEHRGVDGVLGIMPDHNRFAKESAEYLFSWLDASLQALADKRSDPRAVANYLLGFVQSIPYHALRSKDRLRGAGYLTPIQVIRNNLGDCDSKTTLIASALKTLFPRLGIAIVYVPNHALLALRLPAQGNDESITIMGANWLLAEPTGPALYPLGKAAPSSLQFIRSGMFTYQQMDWTPPVFKKAS